MIVVEIDGDGETDGVLVGVTETDGAFLGEFDFEGFGERDGTGEAELDADADGVGEVLEDGVGEGDGVGVEEMLGVGVEHQNQGRSRPVRSASLILKSVQLTIGSGVNCGLTFSWRKPN